MQIIPSKHIQKQSLNQLILQIKQDISNNSHKYHPQFIETFKLISDNTTITNTNTTINSIKQIPTNLLYDLQISKDLETINSIKLDLLKTIAIVKPIFKIQLT